MMSALDGLDLFNQITSIYQLDLKAPMQEEHIANNEALALLRNAEELKALRSESSLFVKKLADHLPLTRDLLDIGLRPTAFQKAKGCQLTADMPALAIDTLVSLYEDFIDLLAFDRILPKDRSLEGLEMEEDDQEAVEAQKEVPPGEEFQLLTHIHQGILEGEPEETAYYYLCRLIGPLSYQRPVELMKFYEERPAVIAKVVEHMDQRALVQLFCKLLECESGKQFFKEYKNTYLLAYLRRLKHALVEQNHQNWLQGLHQVYRFLTEKMEEGSDSNKYLSLLQAINSEDISIIKSINESFNGITQKGLLYSLRWIEEMLKHDSYIMGESNIKLSITFMNRKNSISSNFYKEERLQQKKSHHLSQEHLIEILYLCQKTHQKVVDYHPINSQIAIGLYRVLYFLTRVWNRKTKEKELSQPHMLALLLNQQFFNSTLRIVMSLPQCTILHNCVKELIIECIREAILPPSYFYQPQSPYLSLFLNSFPKNSKNQSFPFSQQLYHIYREVVMIESRVNTQVESRVLEQSLRMSRLIGGDPRKLHADSLRGSSNAFSESSENIEDIIEFDIHSQNSLLGSGKGVPSVAVVKVHNASSIQRGFDEERIVIEGAQEQDD